MARSHAPSLEPGPGSYSGPRAAKAPGPACCRSPPCYRLHPGSRIWASIRRCPQLFHLHVRPANIHRLDLPICTAFPSFLPHTTQRTVPLAGAILRTNIEHPGGCCSFRLVGPPSLDSPPPHRARDLSLGSAPLLLQSPSRQSFLQRPSITAFTKSNRIQSDNLIYRLNTTTTQSYHLSSLVESHLNLCRTPASLPAPMPA